MDRLSSAAVWKDILKINLETFFPLKSIVIWNLPSILDPLDTYLMKPYITFTLDFEYRERKSTLLQSLLSICPFDHLPREIRTIRKDDGKNTFEIQVFFQEVEYHEVIYQHLEKQSKEMEQQLNRVTEGKVSNIEIGVVN
ncbi:MAG: hypothetical protein ACXACW_05820 [Candidatus Hodarchaeales archaeon]